MISITSKQASLLPATSIVYFGNQDNTVDYYCEKNLNMSWWVVSNYGGTASRNYTGKYGCYFIPENYEEKQRLEEIIRKSKRKTTAQTTPF